MSSTRVDWNGILANRVAVVTGSTNGIGFSVARRLAQDGAHVVISSRKQENVDRAVSELQGEGLSVTGTVCHVEKTEDRERLVAKALEHCGAVDFLVCNAAVNPLVGSTLGTSEQIWDKMQDAADLYQDRSPQEGFLVPRQSHLDCPSSQALPLHLSCQFLSHFSPFPEPPDRASKILSVNLKSPALLLSQLLPYMEKRYCRVGVGSSGSWGPERLPIDRHSPLALAYIPKVELGVYNISKTALLGLTRTLALELAPKDIRVNCLVPGLIKTDFSKVVRIGVYLPSSDASYITGENIVVSGFSSRL
ncbi:hypothetical protein P7K49_017850 [Saguinus oedipus]|uniref:Uncharacterized protein n=1 Tax=Saguinus oedipus TaxID=9490 RepID=A0ABQ9V3P1_SAGOE|nr:hypothetical protein P7K49_017850 [Saguinus oedipus]